MVAVMVHEPARRCDNDLAAGFEGALLLFHAGSAVHADNPDARQILRKVLQVAGNLLRKLPRGGKDDGARGPGRGFGDLFKDRDASSLK